MTKDEERRIIAKNIRGAVETTELGRYVCLEGTLFGMGIYARSIESLKCGLDALASLIEPEPRPTCRDDGAEAFRCSRCGAFVKKGAVTDLYAPISIGFCPNCGAKVVDE